MPIPELTNHIIHDRRIQQINQLVLKYNLHDLLPFISRVQQHDLHISFILQPFQDLLTHSNQRLLNLLSFAQSEFKSAADSLEELDYDDSCLERVVRVDE